MRTGGRWAGFARPGAAACLLVVGVAAAGPPTPPDLEKLLVPVQGVAADQLRDTYDDRRGLSRHEAIDIPAPRGTPVLAAGAGTVAKLFTSMRGGLTVYQVEPRGIFAYYYAHLERYEPGLRQGMSLRAGQVIGYVGTTGNAPRDAPHLHFAVLRIGADKAWWKGQAVDPIGALR